MCKFNENLIYCMKNHNKRGPIRIRQNDLQLRPDPQHCRFTNYVYKFSRGNIFAKENF